MLTRYPNVGERVLLTKLSDDIKDSEQAQKYFNERTVLYVCGNEGDKYIRVSPVKDARVGPLYTREELSFLVKKPTVIFL